MPQYLLRFHAGSLVRLTTKAYLDATSGRSLLLNLPYARVAIFDFHVQVAEDLIVPNGLLIQVELTQDNLDVALEHGEFIALHTLSLLSCISFSSVARPRLLWAYDSTPNVASASREFRQCLYEPLPIRPTRRLNDANLFKVLEKNFDSFLNDPNVKDDYKHWVERAITSFRRALADNDDVLTEVLIAWSTMEGLDCVYRDRLPTASTREFKDGMKDVFQRLGQPGQFGPLERLRNDIAHGFMQMDQAVKTAAANVELVRKALALMILRLLKMDDAVCNEVTNQRGYKGTFPAHVRLYARIDFEPGDVGSLDGHPTVSTRVEGTRYVKKEEELELMPNVQFRPENLGVGGMRGEKIEIWGDSGAPLTKTGPTEVSIIRGTPGEREQAGGAAQVRNTPHDASGESQPPGGTGNVNKRLIAVVAVVSGMLGVTLGLIGMAVVSNLLGR